MAILQSKYPMWTSLRIYHGRNSLSRTLTNTGTGQLLIADSGDENGAVHNTTHHYLRSHHLAPDKRESKRPNSSIQLCLGLARRGFKKGDVLAIYLPNVIEYPIIFYGVACLGGVSTSVNPQYSPQDLARQLKTSRARYLVTTPPLAVQASNAGVLDEIRSVFVVGEAQRGYESISVSTIRRWNCIP
ncbi:hypothetical protein OS493_012521 [Desmophyllum pertusum]|uniref:AMP-dependent synthetase/ligase domain-containing protein n=1 Tax=Desmophyllum pertusum TaxID=174260 RepID=A0A9W9ZE75_9CNID|nr:hypothetical protein OS493_012521 [Desmophyllum pertusum]